MDPALPVERLSPVLHLVRAGGGYGWLLLGLGVLLTLWGLLNLLVIRNRLALTLQPLCSLTPALLAVLGVYSSYDRFANMAMAPQAPKPAEFAEVVSFAMACGIEGPLATAIPVIVGVIALAKSTARGSMHSAEISET